MLNSDSASASEYKKRKIDINNSSTIPSRLSLLFCITVNSKLQPSFHAIICTRRVGGTGFLPPTVSRAASIPSTLDYIELQSEDSKVQAIEGALISALSWSKRNVVIPTAPIKDPLAIDLKSLMGVEGEDNQIISKGGGFILWCDPKSVLLLRLNRDKDNEESLQISFLCPIPLPGVGTLNQYGPPPCTVGVPRPLTTEEENRVKKRCVSIGEVILSIYEKQDIHELNPSKKRKKKKLIFSIAVRTIL